MLNTSTLTQSLCPEPPNPWKSNKNGPEKALLWSQMLHLSIYFKITLAGLKKYIFLKLLFNIKFINWKTHLKSTTGNF